MSDFLKSLKNDLEDGEFNSEAAKRINEITKLADKKTNVAANIDELAENVQRRLEDAGIREESEEVAMEQTTEYEQKMTLFKQRDLINSRIVLLSNYKDNILNSITDLLYKTVEFEFEVTEFSKKGEFEEGLLLTEMINEIRTTFKDWVAEDELKIAEEVIEPEVVEEKDVDADSQLDIKFEEEKLNEADREKLIDEWEESGHLNESVPKDEVEEKDDKKEE